MKRDDRSVLYVPASSDKYKQWKEDAGFADSVLKRAARQLLPIKERELVGLYDRRDELTEELEEAQDIVEVAKRVTNGVPLILQKPSGSSLHHMGDFIKNRKKNDELAHWFKFVEENFQTIVVEHDWAKAFDGAEGFEDGDFVLPFDFTCFEFRINDMRILFFLGPNKEGKLEGILATGINGRWYVNAEKFMFENGHIRAASLSMLMKDNRGAVEGFLDLIGRQVRAVSIMIEADIAENTTVKASEKIRAKQQRAGKHMQRDYHVVRLARRHSRPERSNEPGTGSKRRMHFRRGHWRHYDNEHSGAEPYVRDDGWHGSRTRIKWQLVGDPDLGFVNKEYRL